MALKVFRYFLYCIFFLTSGWTQAQNYRPLSQYSTKTWTLREGLPNSSVQDIIQDKDGFIWIGTYGGVVRFDGVYFESYADIFPEHKLVYSNISQGADGKIWLGSGNGVFYFENGKFTQLKGQGDFTPYIESFLNQKDGTLWLGTRSDGLFIYKNGKITKVKGPPILEKAFISDIVQGKNNQFWFASPQVGVFLKDGDNIRQFSEEQGLKSKIINGLYYDASQDRLWVGSNKGLDIIANNKVTSLPALKGVDCIHINFHKGYYYISTVLGLYVVNAEGEVIDKFAFKKSPQVVSSRFDQEGNLWLAGYRSGLSKLTPKKFNEYSQSNGLDGNAINTLLEVAKDSILLANDLGTVFCITKAGIKIHPLSNITKNQRIRDLYKDSNDNIWISTYSGVYRFTKGNITDYKLFDTSNELTNNSTRFAVEDSRKNMWVGTRTGLFRRDSTGKFTVYTKSNNLSNDFILRVFENPKTGNLWIATAGGGVNLLKPDGTIEQMLDKHGKNYNVVFNFHQTKDGAIWIAHNGGLSRYYQGVFKTIPNLFTLENSTLFEIAEDDHGYFWLSTGEGIIRVNLKKMNECFAQDKKKIAYQFFDNSDGILNSSTTPNANILKDSQGYLWIPMVFGVVKVDPNDIPKNALKPPVYVTRIIVDGKIKHRPFNALKVDRKSKRIQIDYTALSYQAIVKVKFKCKLEGYDDDWVDMGSKRSIEYTNLSPGTYTFRVIASNNDGVFNEEGDRLTITIDPAFYETTLFYILLAIMALGAIYFLFRFRTNQIRARNRELQNQVALRTREIQEKMEELEIQKKHISDSINYAKRIQEAILPSQKMLNKALPEHFIFFKPRDVVSGDFYWMSDVRTGDEKIILAAIDCTGHGVPGAFMSMVANDVMNYIVNERKVTQAEQILTMLHIGIRRVLNQKENNNRDGMDMSLVVFNPYTKMLEFAGARNPLVYIKQGELHTVKGDKMPVGGDQWEKERIFTRHEIPLEGIEAFYLFSDGYQDQFGGPKNRKFMIKRFKKLLLDHYTKPIDQQKLILEEALDSWMQESNQSQLDDILVIGVKL